MTADYESALKKAWSKVITFGNREGVCPLCKHTPPDHWKTCALDEEYWELEAEKKKIHAALLEMVDCYALADASHTGSLKQVEHSRKFERRRLRAAVGVDE